MKAIENPVSLHIFVSVYISIRAHVYINSYIHELLIVLMLTRLHGFETSLWLITSVASGSTNCACALLHHLHSGFASSSNSVLDGSLDGDVTPCIPPLTL